MPEIVAGIPPEIAKVKVTAKPAAKMVVKVGERELTPAQRKKALDAQVKIIRDTLRTSFVKVGTALKTIKDKKLQKDTGLTFEEFVLKEFGIKSSQAYRLIEAADLVPVLSPIGEIANEAQARELVAVQSNHPKDEHAAEIVWQTVQDRAEQGEKITAELIRRTAKEIGKGPRKSRSSSSSKGNPINDLPISTLLAQVLARIEKEASTDNPYQLTEFAFEVLQILWNKDVDIIGIVEGWKAEDALTGEVA